VDHKSKDHGTSGSKILQREDAWTVRVKGGVKSKNDEFQEKVHPVFRMILVGGHSHPDGVRSNP